jgi:hypothetical protein
MYYKRFEIDSYLICPKCLKRFDVPIGLPCGNCVCETCVQEFTHTQTVYNGEKSSWEVDCPLCLEKHDVPIYGFPIQKSLSDLLRLSPSKETHDIVVNEFKNLLVECTSKMDDLKMNFKDSVQKINEHSKEIKQKINNRVEILMKMIEKYEKNLVEKLENVEYENGKSLCEYVEGLVKDVNLKLENWNLLINNENNEKQKVKLATIDAVKLIENLDKNIIDLNCLLDEAVTIEFNENEIELIESIVGEIKFNEIEVRSDDMTTKPPLTDDSLFNMVASAIEPETTKLESNDDNNEDINDDKENDKTVETKSPNINFSANDSGVACKTQ